MSKKKKTSVFQGAIFYNLYSETVYLLKFRMLMAKSILTPKALVCFQYGSCGHR